MLDNESREGRMLKCDKELDLQETLNSEDFLEISMAMSGRNKDKWVHKKHPIHNRPLEKITKVICLFWIQKKHIMHVVKIPFIIRDSYLSIYLLQLQIHLRFLLYRLTVKILNHPIFASNITKIFKRQYSFNKIVLGLDIQTNLRTL